MSNPYKRRKDSEQHKQQQQQKKQTKSRGSGTLHDFFGGTDHSTPSFFLLDFPRRRARFLRQLPANTFLLKSNIKWQGKQLQLCSRHPLPAKDKCPQPPRSAYSEHAVSLLKSHLQKCVRRQRRDLVASTTRELIATALSDLVRRLPIIVIEDVCLHEQYPVLVWLMAAVSKGADLPADMLDWMVSFAAALAECPYRDDPESEPESADRFDVRAISKGLKNEEQKTLLYSIQLRQSFGGMACDLAMLNKMTRVWLRRFKADPEGLHWHAVISTPLTQLSLKTTPPLKPTDWEPAAVDFHCSNIIDNLKDKHSELSEERLQFLMWHCSSGINTRQAGRFAVSAATTASDAVGAAGDSPSTKPSSCSLPASSSALSSRSSLPSLAPSSSATTAASARPTSKLKREDWAEWRALKPDARAFAAHVVKRLVQQ